MGTKEFIIKKAVDKEKIIRWFLIIFFLLFFLFSLFAFQIERYDNHIASEDIRNNLLILHACMLSSSLLSSLFIYLKKYKIALVPILIFYLCIIYNVIENL